MFANAPFRHIATLILCTALICDTWAAAPAPPAAAAMPDNAAPMPLAPLGPGDAFQLHVFGQPNMDGTISVADDGTAKIPLVDRPVQVGGMSTDAAARKIEQVFKDGKIFNDPHVTLTVTQSLSQRIAVMGEVRNPGLYPIDSRTTVLSLLARAGGTTALAADVAYILRPDGSGTVRMPVNTRGLSDDSPNSPTRYLRIGDSLYVPEASQFYISGMVRTPGKYKLEVNLTVEKAITIAGGLSELGSMRGAKIKRAGKNGKQVTIKVKPDDLVQAEDLIDIKESLF